MPQPQLYHPISIPLHDEHLREDEADEHHGDDRRRLDDHRGNNARADADDAVARRFRHELAEPAAGHRLKPLGKMLHPEEEYPTSEFFHFLEKRRGLLDGVCITGGEPLGQSDLADFIRRKNDVL